MTAPEKRFRKYHTREEVINAHRKVARDYVQRMRKIHTDLGWKAAQLYFNLELTSEQAKEMLKSQNVPAGVIDALTGNGRYPVMVKVQAKLPTTTKEPQTWEDSWEEPKAL